MFTVSFRQNQIFDGNVGQMSVVENWLQICSKSPCEKFLHWKRRIMNACLSVVELLSHVCGFLYDDGQAAALARLARTCKAFRGQDWFSSLQVFRSLILCSVHSRTRAELLVA